MLRIARTLTVLIPLLIMMPAYAETLHRSGKLQVPSEPVEIDGVEVVPLQSMSGKTVKVTWKMDFSDMTREGARDGMLTLHIRFEVPKGPSPQMRLDFAFFDEKDQLLYTWDMTEYAIKTDTESDPGRFPTWNLFATNDVGMTWSALSSARAYKIVVRTVAEQF